MQRGSPSLNRFYVILSSQSGYASGWIISAQDSNQCYTNNHLPVFQKNHL